MMVLMRNVYMFVVILTGCSSFFTNIGKRQAYKPNPPVDVTLGACMVDKAVIHWALDSNSAPVTKFLIEYNTSYTPNVWINVVNVTDPHQTQAEVPLIPYRNFTFRVITENEHGKSAPSVHTRPPCLTPIGGPYITFDYFVSK
ncbi:neuronal cell adhesion molecule-like [Ruditapes philippinarum]|uniref:neuronal cell adhesion molecule-like n=1 Tax=Ruditapes philippinarum TaxID=129788 RepID=UPI00295A9DBA|nr:neuronal cell adhesion molecule-like [Ruditapes philippinarum]